MHIAKLMLMLIIGSFALAGCDRNEGPAEEAGEAMDEAGNELEETAENAGDAAEEACEEVREGVDAEDADC